MILFGSYKALSLGLWILRKGFASTKKLVLEFGLTHSSPHWDRDDLKRPIASDFRKLMDPFRDEALIHSSHLNWSPGIGDITHTAYNGIIPHPTSAIRVHSNELPELDGQARFVSQILRWEKKWFTVIEASEVTHYNRKIIYQKGK